MKRILYSVIALGMLVSCTQERLPENTDAPLRFSVSISGQTRATNDSFEDGDVLGLYGFAHNEDKEEGYASEQLISNEIVDYYAGQAFTRTPVYFPEIEGTMDFCMYYPYDDYKFNGSFLTFFLKYDQSTLEEHKGADIMLAHSDNVSKSSEPITFTFERLMSKITLRLKAGEGYSSAQDLVSAKVLFTDVKNQAVTYFAQKKVNAVGLCNMTPYGHFYVTSDGVAEGVSIILPPQSFMEGRQFININLNGQYYSVETQDALTLESGKEYVYTLTLNRNTDGNVIKVTPTVKDWTEGIREDITLDPSDPELMPLYDYDGNKYKVVRIGEQIWMAENLRTTHFNDGTPIPYVTDQADWDFTDISESPAYCYYGNDEANAELHGALYNWFTAREPNICPKGWYVPTTADWAELISYLGTDAGKKLKSTSGWKDEQGNEQPQFQGTDDYGFNALPSGYRRHRKDFEKFGSQGKWWTPELCPTDNAAGNYYYLVSNDNNVKTLFHLKEYGLSIRCIKGEEIVEPDEDDYVENGVNYGPGTEVDGLLWAPVNCGYDKDDYKYGKLFQWGRPFGQGYENDGVNPADENDTYALGDNLVNPASNDAQGADPANKDKHFRQYWNDDWCIKREYSPVWKSEYNPCPEGWRVPTKEEFESLSENISVHMEQDVCKGLYLSGSQPCDGSAARVYLPASGLRDVSSNSTGRETKSICYWTSTYGGSKPYCLYNYGTFATVMENSAAISYAVRCVRDIE